MAHNRLRECFHDLWYGHAEPPGSRVMEHLRRKGLGPALLCDDYRVIPSDGEATNLPKVTVRKVRFGPSVIIPHQNGMIPTPLRGNNRAKSTQATTPGSHEEAHEEAHEDFLVYQDGILTGVYATTSSSRAVFIETQTDCQ